MSKKRTPKLRICPKCGQTLGLGDKIARHADKMSKIADALDRDMAEMESAVDKMDAILVQEELEEMREGTRDHLGDDPEKATA